MPSTSDAIKILEAYERGQPVEARPMNDTEWRQIARNGYVFDFQHYHYRVVVFPTATFAIYSPVTRKLGPNSYDSPTDATQAAYQANLKGPSDHWTPIRLVECGQQIDRDSQRDNVHEVRRGQSTKAG